MPSATSTYAPPNMPAIIAVVGSDGAGKSTVTEALLAWMRETRPTELCHLGKQSGNLRRAVAHWPILGKRIDDTIRTKARKAREPRGPGALPALVVFMFLMRRVYRFRRMLAIRGRGFTILADRFPQREMPGSIDGPGLTKVTKEGGWLAGVLSRRERDYYIWMTSHSPTLVIRLNVDLETAIRRKPDHRPTALKNKVEDVPRLTFGGAPIAEIDATQPLDMVVDKAKRAIANALGDPRLSADPSV